MFDFVPSDKLAKQLAKHRSRFSAKRLDATPERKPSWFAPVDPETIKENVRSRFNLFFGELTRQIRKKGQTSIQIVRGSEFVGDLKTVVRKALHLKSGKSGNVLAWRLAGELGLWLKAKEGSVWHLPYDSHLAVRGENVRLVLGRPE